MPTETTAAASGLNDILVQFDELCALARDGLKEADFDIAVAAFTAASLTLDQYVAQHWAEQRLAHIRVGAQREVVAS